MYAPTTEAEWQRYYAEMLKEELPLTLAPFKGYYYNQYGLTHQDLSDFLFDAWLYGEWSKDGTAEIDFKELFESGPAFPLTSRTRYRNTQSVGIGSPCCSPPPLKLRTVMKPPYLAP